MNAGKFWKPAARPPCCLFAPWGRMDGTLLEELFSEVARDAVVAVAKPAATEWFRSRAERYQLARPRSGPRRRLRRSRVRWQRDRGSWRETSTRWLIHVEDEGSQQTLRDSEQRLQAEMAGLLDSIESGVLLLDADGHDSHGERPAGVDLRNGIPPLVGTWHD